MARYSSSEVRLHLMETLRTDSDLNAFCLDHFPKVQQRFTNSMDRLAKINLLFEVERDPDEVMRKLTLAHPDVHRPPAQSSLPNHHSTGRLIAGAIFGTAFSAILFIVMKLQESHPIHVPMPPIDASFGIPPRPVDLISSASKSCLPPNVCLSGIDDMGRDATYKMLRIDTLAYGDSWDFGSSSNIHYGNRITGVADYINKHENHIRHFIGNAKYGLIAVGSASQEGGEEEESARAGERANELRRIFLQSKYGNQFNLSYYPIYTLNLGKCNGARQIENCGTASMNSLTRRTETRCQRAVIIIAIIDAENGVNHEQALKDAMRKDVIRPDTQNKQFPYDFERDFGKFELRRAQY